MVYSVFSAVELCGTPNPIRRWTAELWLIVTRSLDGGVSACRPDEDKRRAGRERARAERQNDRAANSHQTRAAAKNNAALFLPATPPPKSAHHLFVNNQTHNFSPTEEASN